MHFVSVKAEDYPASNSIFAAAGILDGPRRSATNLHSATLAACYALAKNANSATSQWFFNHRRITRDLDAQMVALPCLAAWWAMA